MSNQPESREHFLRRIRRNAVRIVRCIDEDMPPLIIAQFAVGLVHSLEGLCAKEFWELFAEQQAEVARQRACFCQHCEATCDPAEGYPFVCEACEKRIDKKIDQTMGNDDWRGG